MCSVHIGIGHDHNLIVTEFGNIEIVSISFGKATSKSVDHGLDLRIGQYLVDGGLLYIEDLTADRQDSLIVTVSGSLGRTAGGISLYNKDLAERRIFLLTVGQLAVGIKRVFLLGEKIGLGTFFRLTDLGRFFRTGKYRLQCFQVSVKEEYQLFPCHFTGGSGRILVVQLGLGLALKTGCRMFDGDNGCHTISDICSCKVGIFIFQYTDLTCVSVHYGCKGCLKTGQMCSAFCIVDIVTESKDVLTKFIGKLKSYLHLDSVCLSFKVNRIMKWLRVLIEVTDKSYDSLRLMVLDIFDRIPSPVLKMDRKFRVQVCSLVKTALYIGRPESCFLKDLRVRKEIHTGSGSSGFPQLREKSCFQFNGRDSSLIMVMMYIAVTADLNIQIGGQCIYNRRAHAMKSTACLICGIIKLTACMKSCKNKSFR